MTNFHRIIASEKINLKGKPRGHSADRSPQDRINSTEANPDRCFSNLSLKEDSDVKTTQLPLGVQLSASLFLGQEGFS